MFYTRRVIDQGSDNERFVPILRAFTVFNTDQIEGLPAKYQPVANEPVAIVKEKQIERIARAEEFFETIGAKVTHGGNKAFYVISQDRIQLPNFEDFHSAESYYVTRGHESVHWTRHQSRLNRDFGRQRWGDEGYAMEELVAEIGTAYLASDLDLSAEPREDHASYIASWLKALKNDKKAIFIAASAAEKAVKFLHEIVTPAQVEVTPEISEDDADDIDERLAA